MGYRRTPFAPGEWYHCFSRGIDGRTVFETRDDFLKFKALLYLANDTERINKESSRSLSFQQILHLPRKESIVAIGAYCLMGNHPHLLLQEKTEHGISKFMHKVGTGYTKYFNLKRGRIGNLMVKPFRSKHVADDKYLRQVTQYIHINPAEIYEPGWKKGEVKDLQRLEEKLKHYEHSSLPDYLPTGVASVERLERKILDPDAMQLIGYNLPALATILADAALYYKEAGAEFGKKPLPLASPVGH